MRVQLVEDSVDLFGVGRQPRTHVLQEGDPIGIGPTRERGAVSTAPMAGTSATNTSLLTRRPSLISRVARPTSRDPPLRRRDGPGDGDAASERGRSGGAKGQAGLSGLLVDAVRWAITVRTPITRAAAITSLAENSNLLLDVTRSYYRRGHHRPPCHSWRGFATPC